MDNFRKPFLNCECFRDSQKIPEFYKLLCTKTKKKKVEYSEKSIYPRLKDKSFKFLQKLLYTKGLFGNLSM